jgi:hypothetical protein
MSLHDILDRFDAAIASKVRSVLGQDLGPVDQILGELRTHADKEAALLEQQAVADVHQVESDAEAAAAPVLQEVESDAKDLASTAATDVQSALGGSAAAQSTPTPASEAPAEQTAPAETPAPAEAQPEAAAPSEPATDSAPQA